MKMLFQFNHGNFKKRARIFAERAKKVAKTAKKTPKIPDLKKKVV